MSEGMFWIFDHNFQMIEGGKYRVLFDEVAADTPRVDVVAEAFFVGSIDFNNEEVFPTAVPRV